MKFTAVLALLGIFLAVHEVIGQQSSPWSWVCENKECQRILKPDGATRVPMEICKLNCEDAGSLFPRPSGTTVVGKTLTPLFPAKVVYSNLATFPVELRNMLTEASEIFRGYLLQMHPEYMGAGVDPFPASGAAENNTLFVTFTIVSQTETRLKLNSNESYALQISLDPDNRNIRASIQSQNYFGARHALESLSQIIGYDEDLNTLQIVNAVNIVDAPAHPYRGLHLDTSRNFFSIESLRRVIEGMSYNKLNMFHWHITDTHSFPMEVPAYPQMTQYGAYSPKKIYSIQEMKDLVQYARIRGVKIVAEFDEPAHTGSGWEWGPEQGLGELVVCHRKEPWFDFCVEPPCGQLNLVNENMYTVLNEVFKSMLTIFDNDLFHMGGDEVDFRCYNTTPEITEYMVANNYSLQNDGFLQLWSEFQNRAHGMLVNASTDKDLQSILWTSGLTEPEHVEKYLNASEYIIQIWSDSQNAVIPALLDNGFRAIFTNYDALYLDCGFHHWIGDGNNWCSPYKGWQLIYENSPFKIYENLTNTSMATSAFENGQLIGAETALWTEQADELSVESRLWPRACAHAERLWTNPQTTGWKDAEGRMISNRERYVQRGLKPDRLKPEYCSQNENKCYGYFAPDEEETPVPIPTSPVDEKSGAISANIFVTQVRILLFAIISLLFV